MEEMDSYVPTDKEIEPAANNMTSEQEEMAEERSNETAHLPGISLSEALENGAEEIYRYSDINAEIGRDLEEGLVTERGVAERFGLKVAEDENLFLYMDGGPTNIVFVTYPKPGTSRYDELTAQHPEE